MKTPVTLLPEALDFARLIRPGDTVGWAEATAEPNKTAPSTVTSAHMMSPCAVSRKKTSCVCVLTHLERSRPVR